MTIDVTGPDGSRVSFPDGTDAATINGVMSQHFGGGGQQPEQTWGEWGAGVGRHALQGATFNFADDIGLIDKEKTEAFGRSNPVASTVASIAGGVAPFVAGPGAGIARLAIGSTLPRTIARSAGVGAGVGGVAGFGAGEGGVAERLPSAGTGAALGAGLGAAIPPVVAGASRALDVAGRMVAPRSALGRRASEMPPGEPPVPPQGAQYEPGGQQSGRVQWVDDHTGGAPPAGAPPTPPNEQSLNSMDRGIQHLADAAMRAGMPRDRIMPRIAEYYRYMNIHQPGKLEAFQYHTGSYGPSTATLVEIFPELAETLGQAARQNPQVFNEASQFFQARQTGITPPQGGLTQRQLAERGVPTRGHFDAPIRQDQSEASLGRQFGRTTPITPAQNTPTVSMGMRDRAMEHVKRLFKVSDSEYHGHAATPEQHLPQIIEAQRANAQTNYNAAIDWADSAGANLRPTIEAVIKRWADNPEMRVPLYRRALRKISREFLEEDGRALTSLRSFDTAKKAADDLIGKMHQENLGNAGGRMTEFKNELLAAVDQATERTPGANDSLYRTARNMFSSESESRDIMTAYRDLVKGVNPGERIRFEPGATHFATLSTENQKLAKAGLMWGYRDMTKGRELNRSILGIFNTPRMRELMQQLGPDTGTGLEDLGRFLGVEAAGRQAEQVALRGSQTARNVQSDEAFQAFQAVHQATTTLQRLFRGSSGVFDTAFRAWEMVVERSLGITADSARDMGRLLLTADPSEQIRIMQRVVAAMPADRMARFTELMERVARYATTPGTAAAAGHVGTQQQAPREPTFL